VKYLIIIVALILTANVKAQETCATPLKPSFNATVEEDLKTKLAQAKQDHEKDPTNGEAIIWYGRRTAYLGNYEEAIQIFTKGIELHPQDARMYRHRGHRYITLRCFDKAIADFESAARLVKGKKDEVEPDGMPNAQNIPTSTLQSNIWYHLGLAYYLKADFAKAVTAFKNGLKVSANADMYVATANWLNLSLLRAGNKSESKKLLKSISKDIKLIENEDYLKILLLYKDDAPCSILSENDQIQSLSSATLEFGKGSYCLLKGNKQHAKTIFQKIINGNQWASFAYIAAEQELKRLD
jgi:tetratricopeptide (TPR) repeat protein